MTIKLIKNFGKINSIVLLICVILLILEFVGHRHGEFKIEELLFFPALLVIFPVLLFLKLALH